MTVAEYEEKTLELLFEILKEQDYKISKTSTNYHTEYIVYSDQKERIFSIRRQEMRYSISGKRAPDEYVFYIDNVKTDFSRDNMKKIYDATEQGFQEREEKRMAEEKQKKSEQQNATFSFLGKFLTGRDNDKK